MSAPLIAPARIGTTRTNTVTGVTTQILSGVPASIASPGPKDAAPEGGVIHYIVCVGPNWDIQPQDMLTIQSWGRFSVNTTRQYRVFSAPMVGTFGLEVYRCSVGDWIGR